MAIGTVDADPLESPESTSSSLGTLPAKPGDDPSLVEGFVKAFTFTSNYRNA
ncbi:hypothetical protein SAMN05192584_102209 [Streptomyces pini]|uniref:Uncharacterized protein n=1 Tax=Streptomyces pini TaxID=1520580 RepID=A0A1I3V8P3_9ACTN|nr:hypothetical protein SAMN05192584_102209 [Streptomyces pini]